MKTLYPLQYNDTSFHQSGYRRKVVKGRIGRRGGGSSGATFFARVVRHPGQKATDLDMTIADKWQPKLTKMVKQDIRDATN